MVMREHSLTDRQTRYNSIDLAKFVMAICVIAIHTHPLENCLNIAAVKVYSSFVDGAVPFFFLAAGYLLAVKLHWPYDSSYDFKRIQNYLTKTIKLYLFWSVIYFPLALHHYINSGRSILFSVLDYVRGLIFVGEHYNSWILWYLLSTIYALIFVLIFLKRHISPYILFACGAILLFISISFDGLMQFDGSLPIFMQQIKRLITITIASGRILKGAFYIPCGMLLANKRSNIRINIIFFCIGFITSCFVSSIFIRSVLIPVYSVALFGIIVQIKLKDISLYPILRKMSTIMYFIHLYIWTCYYTIIYGQKTYGMDNFLFTTIICIALSYGYIYIKDHWKSRKL